MTTAALPDTPILEIDCSVIYRHFSLPARVTISPGRVHCVVKKVFGLGASQIVHQRREITFVHAHLLPYPLRTTIEVVGGAGERAYLSPYRGLSRIRAALQEAGFVVGDRSAWLFSGGQLWVRR